MCYQKQATPMSRTISKDFFLKLIFIDAALNQKPNISSSHKTLKKSNIYIYVCLYTSGYVVGTFSLHVRIFWKTFDRSFPAYAFFFFEVEISRSCRTECSLRRCVSACFHVIRICEMSLNTNDMLLCTYSHPLFF